MASIILFDNGFTRLAEGNRFTYTLSVAGVRDEDLTIRYSFIPGTATPRDDYRPISREFTLPATTNPSLHETFEIPLVSFDDGLEEGEETVTFSIELEGGQFTNGLTEQTRTTTIVDDEPLTGRPVLRGDMIAGGELSVDTSRLDDPDGLTIRSYVWHFAREDGSIVGTIGGLSGENIVIPENYGGHYLAVTVYTVGDNGIVETATSRRTPLIRDTPVRLDGTEGNDSLDGATGNDRLRGLAGDDRLYGDLGADRLFGGPGNDSLHGEEGGDHLVGGGGSDLIRGQEGNDVILGGAGRDDIFGGDGADEIRGGAGHDEVRGEAGKDVLFGGAGRDAINGSSGADRIDGGRGRDDVSGGSGRDVITLGAGADMIRFFDGDGRDRVTDFAAGIDTLYLSPDLWARDREVAEVIADFADPRGSDLVLAFPGGERLTLTGYLDQGSLGTLEVDITLF